MWRCSTGDGFDTFDDSILLHSADDNVDDADDDEDIDDDDEDDEDDVRCEYAAGISPLSTDCKVVA